MGMRDQHMNRSRYGYAYIIYCEHEDVVNWTATLINLNQIKSKKLLF